MLAQLGVSVGGGQAGPRPSPGGTHQNSLLFYWDLVPRVGSLSRTTVTVSGQKAQTRGSSQKGVLFFQLKDQGYPACQRVYLRQLTSLRLLICSDPSTAVTHTPLPFPPQFREVEINFQSNDRTPEAEYSP